MIGPDGARHVAKVLETTRYIQEVWLSNNGVFPDGAAALGKALQDKKFLEVLCLKRNDIGFSGMKEL